MSKKTLTLLSFGLLLAVGAPLAAQQAGASGGDTCECAGDRGHGPRHARLFDRADADTDGFVTFDEFASGPLGRFAEADVDGDGAIDAAEVDAAREAARARFEERRGQRDGGEHGRRGGAPGDRFERADADGDGRVTDVELVARLESLFSELDADGDGAVTEDEAAAFRPRGRDGERGAGSPRGGR